MVKMKVTVTKQNYQDALFCGIAQYKSPAENCAIALAIRDLFPNAVVGRDTIFVNGPFTKHDDKVIQLPIEATDLIDKFDGLCSPQLCHERLDLPETTFEIEIPDQVIDGIPLPNIARIMEGHPNMELVMAED